LKPGGIVSVTEGIFDPNFQRRSTITELACAVGFGKLPFSAKNIAYVLHLEDPVIIES
jgi:hypothetical protein